MPLLLLLHNPSTYEKSTPSLAQENSCSNEARTRWSFSPFGGFCFFFCLLLLSAQTSFRKYECNGQTQGPDFAFLTLSSVIQTCSIPCVVKNAKACPICQVFFLSPFASLCLVRSWCDSPSILDTVVARWCDPAPIVHSDSEDRNRKRSESRSSVLSVCCPKTSSFFFLLLLLLLVSSWEDKKTTYSRQGLVDDNTVTDKGSKEGTRVPMGTLLVAKCSPVGEVKGSANQHRDVTQPPDELRSLSSFSRSSKSQERKKKRDDIKRMRKGLEKKRVVWTKE
jgi:hypothetical protein